jgi:hypothetical protein
MVARVSNKVINRLGPVVMNINGLSTRSETRGLRPTNASDAAS